jgi:Matrixin/Putative peptidoglycan binding domain
LVLNIPNKIGIKPGDEGEEVKELQNYLKKFGYIDADKLARSFGVAVDTKRAPTEPATPGVFDDVTQRALRSFQQFYALPVTGDLNKPTVNLMLKPRCGVFDLVKEHKRFVAVGTKWDKTDLTYRFENFTPDLNQDSIKKAIEIALKQWTSVSPLTFSEVTTGGDIILKWGALDHGCGIAFDGPSGVLAHAYYPGTGKDGTVDFDEDEMWSDNDPPTGIDVASVALHELGHTFGLNHSDNRQAVMYAYYGGRLLNLYPDDIAGIQSIYGSNG